MIVLFCDCNSAKLWKMLRIIHSIVTQKEMLGSILCMLEILIAFLTFSDQFAYAHLNGNAESVQNYSK